MEWEPGVQDLYEGIVAGVPEMLRSMVRGLLIETARKQSRERTAASVSEGDLVTALFEITPDPFKTQCTDQLRALGVNVERYVELKRIRDQYRVSWQQFGKAFHPTSYHFAMYLTDRCNQRCLHCAAEPVRSRSELAAEQWFEIIENIESSLVNQGRRGVYIWFGGEPTCREDLREIIQYCGRQGHLQAMITNGVLFDEELACFCADQGMSHVFVSFDSAKPEGNDLIRGSRQSLEFAERAVRNARKYGLFVCCSVTVMRQNIHELEEIQALAESWGAVAYFRAVVRQRSAARNWAEIGLTCRDYRTLYDFKYKQAIEAIRNGRAGALPVFAIFEMVPFMETPLDDTEVTALEWGVGCQACRSMSGIDVNGDIFPCGYPSSLTLGNALTDRFGDVMNSQMFRDIRDRKRTGKCASCHHVSLCGGGCRVHTECETGDFFASFPYCWHEHDEHAVSGSVAPAGRMPKEG